MKVLGWTMGSSLTTQDFTCFAAISEFQIKTTVSKGTLDQFVTTAEEPGIHKPVNGSPSSIWRLIFPLFWEYFQ